MIWAHTMLLQILYDSSIFGWGVWEPNGLKIEKSDWEPSYSGFDIREFSSLFPAFDPLSYLLYLPALDPFNDFYDF